MLYTTVSLATIIALVAAAPQTNSGQPPPIKTINRVTPTVRLPGSALDGQPINAAYGGFFIGRKTTIGPCADFAGCDTYTNVTAINFEQDASKAILVRPLLFPIPHLANPFPRTPISAPRKPSTSPSAANSPTPPQARPFPAMPKEERSRAGSSSPRTARRTGRSSSTRARDSRHGLRVRLLMLGCGGSGPRAWRIGVVV